MKKIFSKTLKFRKFTLSVFSNEVVVVFIGDKRIFIKTIRIFAPFRGMFRRRAPRKRTPRLRQPRTGGSFPTRMSAHRKKLAFALFGVIVAIVFVFSQYPLKNREAAPVDDEAIKKNLLESKQTDYSSPDKHAKLVINIHTVKEGECLNKIAKKYGVSVDTIRGSNNISSEYNLGIGRILKIPNKDGIVLNMPRGGGLVAIAKKYHVSLKKIIEENNIKNPDFIAANTVLFIPDAKPLNIFSGFLWPASTRSITCGYGWRRSPFDPSQSEFHSGIDIRSNYQRVRASKYGKITFTGWLGGYGKAVVIAHPGGWKTLYAHLSRIIVRAGQYVKQGQAIAVSGNTGRSTGAHLHFEIIRNGRNINPYIYFRKRRN